ncbi:MAG: site-2 protease family protein, partial [Gemmiger sp.]
MTTLLTMAVSILVFGAVIFVHEFGHFLAAKHNGIQVNEFSIGMGPALWQKEKNGTLYSIRLLPIGGFNAMEGEDGEEETEGTNNTPKRTSFWPAVVDHKPFSAASVGQRMVVIASGALMNFLLGIIVLIVLVAGQEGPITSKIIYDFYDGAISAQTGLRPGDEVLAVNGRHCFVAADIVYELQRAENYTADFTVRRDGEKVELKNVQFGTQTDGDGNVRMVLEFSVYGITKTPRTVVHEAVNEFAYYARLIIRSLADLVMGRVSV